MTKHRHVIYQTVCYEIIQPFVMMVAMDTKFGTIYCAISDVRHFFIFATPTPQNFSNSNETYGILKN